MILGKKKKAKLDSILDLSPDLKKILKNRDSVEQKRIKLRNWLAQQLSDTYEENPDIQPLEYILVREALNVLRKIVSSRSEKLSNFSFLTYIDNLISNNNTLGENDQPSNGFFKEFEHLIKGITGKSGIYSTKHAAFTKYEGSKAAKLRSADLSTMARQSSQFMQSYSCGLDNDALRRRSRNKYRILQKFGATELEWNKYNWHLNNTIRDADTLIKFVKLDEQEYEAVRLAKELKIPFGITPYYLSLFDVETGGARDKAVRAQVLPSLHYVKTLSEQKSEACASMDFMLERDTSPIEGITRRYPNIVILKPVLTCPQICVYCQRNWQIEDVYSTRAALEQEKLDKALEWISQTPEINEVLITGGDPFLLSNKKIEYVISKVASNKNIVRIRIGTRTPVTLPQRITESLVRSISRFHIPGRREVLIITHFEHPYEITPQSMEAVQKFKRVGIGVYNQLVYTYYTSKKFEAALLRQKLRLIGVTPYYTFNTKGKEETNDFRVPIARLIQEQNEEARIVPGSVRTDEIVFNVPGLGKNYLKASQHHDIISILPDGQRVYEFHPWEKKLGLANTYVYKDTAIDNYLQRLKDDGEDLSNYKTIWYYY
ncbi:MAG: KamA family radical SAM protein [Desulfobacteraceae bacterium]|nr:KamA family radical SAM protein [Desulfobacteraceae bacterium]